MLSTQFKDGALSKQTYIEKSSIVSDASQEVERLESEGSVNKSVE